MGCVGENNFFYSESLWLEIRLALLMVQSNQHRRIEPRGEPPPSSFTEMGRDSEAWVTSVKNRHDVNGIADEGLPWLRK